MISILADTVENQNFEFNELKLNDTQINFVSCKPRLRHSLKTLSSMTIMIIVLNLQNTTQLTLFNIFALIVEEVIGSGIFSSPSQIDQNVSSLDVAILV